jgi:hypothetical protein
MVVIMETSIKKHKSQRVSLARKVDRAYSFAKAGIRPEEAWQKALEELYPQGEGLKNQEIHTCPKWAFCILCHKGELKEVKRGECPQAEGQPSAVYALETLKLLKADPSLADKPAKLREMVFGKKESQDYRTPNGEERVVLLLCGKTNGRESD